MSTDVKLHVLTDVTTEEEVNYFNSATSFRTEEDYKRMHDAYTHVAETPSFYIGEDASYTAEREMQAIFTINHLVSCDPIELTGDLLIKIVAALPGETPYDLEQRRKAEHFLRPYIGYKVFVISW